MESKIKDCIGDVEKLKNFTENVRKDLSGCVITKVMYGVSEKNYPLIHIRLYSIAKDCKAALEIHSDGTILFGQIF